MSAVRVLVVKMGGGSLKAVLPDRDERELFGRLKSRGISQPLQFPVRAMKNNAK